VEKVLFSISQRERAIKVSGKMRELKCENCFPWLGTEREKKTKKRTIRRVAEEMSTNKRGGGKRYLSGNTGGWRCWKGVCRQKDRESKQHKGRSI